MDSTICIRCGLPNASFRYIAEFYTAGSTGTLKSNLPLGGFGCVRCGLPNERLVNYAQDSSRRLSSMNLTMDGSVTK